jgi:glucose/arabinose dehydrogenase
MATLTGIDLRGWGVLGVLTLAAVLLYRARPSTRLAGSRVLDWLIIPLGAALVLVVDILVKHLDALRDLGAAGSLRPSPVMALVALVVVVVAVVNLLFERVLPLLVVLPVVRRLSARMAADVAMAMMLGATVVAALIFLGRAEQAHHLAAAQAPQPVTSSGPVGPMTQPSASPSSALAISSRVEHLESIELPGQPMDIVAVDARSGYVSLDTGGIVRYELPAAEGSPMIVRRVADDLHHARGIAVRDGTLYVVELGDFPCPDARTLCRGSDVDPASAADGEAAILQAMRGRVLAFDVGADGSLADVRTVISDLPVTAGDHAVNGMELGPDGWLYLPVGNVDQLWWNPGRALTLTPHPEWLGALLRFDGSGTAPEVVARGTRNIREVVFDPTGGIWGVDNAGFAQDGWRTEEVLHIRPGHDYGYPQHGSFAAGRVPEDEMAWVSQTTGTAGLAWAGDVGLGDGLLVGSCGQMSILEPRATWRTQLPWERRLWSGSQTVLLGGVPGCITSIEPIAPGLVMAAVDGDGASGGRVYLVRMASPV